MYISEKSFICDSDYCNHCCSISSVCNPGVDFKDAMRLGYQDLKLQCHSFSQVFSEVG